MLSDKREGYLKMNTPNIKHARYTLMLGTWETLYVDWKNNNNNSELQLSTSYVCKAVFWAFHEH